MLWKKVLLAVGLGLVVISTAVTIFLYGSYQHILVHKNSSNTTPTATPQPSEDPATRPFSVLLLGYGGGGHEGGKLSDSMIVVYVQPKTEQIFLISLPRDLWTSLPVKEGELSNWKINAAYAIGSDDRSYPHKPAQFTGEAGGGELAKYAVEQVLGIHVDYFASLNFHGFKKTIDTLNGVDVRVEKTFDDFQYPIEGMETDPCGRTPEQIAATVATLSASLVEKEFTCRYEHLHFDRGIVHMDGETALKFVRSRHAVQDGGDFGRAARQRALMVAVKNRVIALSFIPKIVPFITSLRQDLETDVNLDQVRAWLDRQAEFKNYQIESIALTDKNVLKLSTSANRQSILVAKDGEDWSSVHVWLQEQLAGQTASDSAELNKAL